MARSAVRGPMLLSVGKTVLVVCMSSPSAQSAFLDMTDGGVALATRLQECATWLMTRISVMLCGFA